MSNFEGKVALVTGASGGMGSAITKALREEGARVATVDLVADCENSDFHVAGDLTDGLFCDELPSRAVEELGRLDILINNAGLMRRGPITDATDEDFRLSFAVNVEAPFRLCRAAIPIMEKAGGGTIVNTASCWGKYPGPDHVIYCTTKAAIAAMTQCLGRDCAPMNIRVNAVCPNEVDTPMLRTGFEIRGLDPETAIEHLNSTVPIGRVASPDEIANVVLFLASDKSSYLCGSLIEINGGKPVY